METSKSIFKAHKASDSSGEPRSSEELPFYSHVIEPTVPGHVVELSGIVGTDSTDPNRLIGGGIERETKRIFELIEAQLKAASLSFRNVMKIEVKLAGHLTDDSGKNAQDFAIMNDIYREKFKDYSPPPARYTVGGLQLWHHARVEMVVTAWRPDSIEEQE